MNQYTVGPEALVSSAQNLTGAWADLGGEILTKGVRFFGLWLVVDINDSLNVRVRLQVKHTAGASGSEFSFPIKTVSASSVAVEAEYFELNVDADQNIILGFDLDRLVPIVQVQVMAGTAGASPGQIDAAHITMGY